MKRYYKKRYYKMVKLVMYGNPKETIDKQTVVAEAKDKYTASRIVKALNTHISIKSKK